jgi:hypothetical protein
LAHSGNGGQTVDSRIDAHDAAAGSLFQHPQLVREASTGALDLIYYAGNGTNDSNGSFRRSRAAVPAMGFAASVVLDSPIVFLESRTDQRWLGDYTGIYTLNGELYTSYVTNRTGSAQIAFDKVPLP